MRSENNTSKLGSLMLLAAWLLFMAILTYVFSKWFEHVDNPNAEVITKLRSDGIYEVILKANRLNQLMKSDLTPFSWGPTFHCMRKGHHGAWCTYK